MVEQSSFQLLSVPARFPRNSDSPKYRAFPEVVRINIGGSGGSQVLIQAPAAAPILREPREIHLRRRDVLNHCMEADQRAIVVSIRRIVEGEWWDLLSKPESPETIA